MQEEYTKKYYREHREKIIEYNKNYYQENKERVRKYQKAYKDKYKDIHNARRRLERARIKGPDNWLDRRLDELNDMREYMGLSKKTDIELIILYKDILK